MKTLKTLALTVALFATQSITANASTYDYNFGDMGPTASGVTKTITADANGTWNNYDYDTFAFTISATTNVSGSAPDVDLKYSFADVDVKSVQLFKSVSGSDPQIGSTDTSTELFSFSNLGAGDYYLVVGVVGRNAEYKVTLTTSPTASAVPEPEQYAMMLAGLGLIGFATRRKLA